MVVAVVHCFSGNYYDLIIYHPKKVSFPSTTDITWGKYFGNLWFPIKKAITNSPPFIIFHNYKAEFNGGRVESVPLLRIQNTG